MKTALEILDEMERDAELATLAATRKRLKRCVAALRAADAFIRRMQDGMYHVAADKAKEEVAKILRGEK